DDKGRITQLQDFDQRAIKYEYDSSGRLQTVTSPSVSSVQSSGANFSPTDGGIKTTYAYQSNSGDLATTLSARGKLNSITDGKNQNWLQVTYGDLHSIGRPEEVQSQTLGSGNFSFSYTFDSHTASVSDADGNAIQYTMAEGGQIQKL